MTRRKLLEALAIGGTVAMLGGCEGDSNPVPVTVASPDAVPPPVPPPPNPPVPPAFVQPTVRSAGPAGNLDTALACRMGNNNLGGTQFNTRTYEGAICGPTLRVRPGQTLRVRIDNQLPPNPDQNAMIANMNTPHHFNSTNLHTHGLHVSPQGQSDNIFVDIEPGDSFQYVYQIPANHPPGTYFYHPHKHGSASVQMFGGMAGALIVEGGLDNVPEIAAARDLVFLINELNINPVTGMTPDFTGQVFSQNAASRFFTVNGQRNPVLQVFSGEVIRLRVINASPRALLPFQIQGHAMHQLAFDGITLPEVRTTNQPIQLAPANRVDLVIKAGAPGDYAIRKELDNTNNPNPIQIATLRVLPTTVNMALPTGALPVPPTLTDIPLAEVQTFRTITFTEANSPMAPLPNFPLFTIDCGNGGGPLQFDPNRIDLTIPLGAVEQWQLVNTGNVEHPFHIHINPFLLVAVDGVPLPVPEWRDTINIPRQGSVTIRHRFEDFTGMFVFHCHILPHEDTGMMAIVNVV